MVLTVDVADLLGITFGGAYAFMADDFLLARTKSVSNTVRDRLGVELDRF